MVNVCGWTTGPENPPDSGGGICCFGATMGPDKCTCWVPAFNFPQEPLQVNKTPSVRNQPCEDCAYSVDSPERNSDERVTGDPALLKRIVANGEPFFCHVGMRRILHWVHQNGQTYAEGDCDYRPPIKEGIAYKADGTPADICSGWFKRRVLATKGITT